MKRIAFVISLSLLGAATLASAPGAAPGSGTITPDVTTLTWTGEVATPTAPPPAVPQLCEVGLCDEFTFTVALGDHWVANPGSIEIAIRWAPYDGETDLDFYVFGADPLPIATAANVDSNAESVFLPALADGTYRVRVVASTVAAFPKAYEGLIQVEPGRPNGEGAPLLPNLVALPPTNFHIATTPYHLFPTPENPLLSCYPEETVENPSHPTRCLRFNQVIGNTGAGALELRFGLQNVASASAEDQRLLQRIYNDDGTFSEEQVDTFEFHPVHGHVHYRGFGQSKLYRYDWELGRLDGGVPARNGNKVGFCLIDVMLMDEYWGAQGNGARTRTFPTCNLPQELEAPNLWVVMGIDVGWADVYGWNLADQYIDITGLASGLYEIEQLANPNGLDGDAGTPAVVESDYTDNTASAFICLSDAGVTAASPGDVCLD